MRSFRSFGTTVPKMLWQPINDQGGGNYRMMLPASLLRKHGYAVTQAHPFPLRPEDLQVLDPDVVAFQLFQTEKQIERIRSYKSALPSGFLVYEIDDLFWAVPEGSWHRNNPLLPTSKSNIRTAAKLCDAIVCSTPDLAEEMRKLTGMRDVRVVPNLVPRSFIHAALAGRREAEPSNKIRVGWAGGIGHGGDLKVISQAMREIGTEVQWVFFGMLPPDISPGENVEYYPGVAFNDYANKLGKLNLDIALAPLEENDFNRCKSDLRVLEYAAAGYPVIASDVSTYRDCPYVHWAANNPEAWTAAIRSLVADSEARDGLREGLHQWLLTNRCLDDHLPERLKSYLPPKSEPFVPTLAGKQFGSVVTVGAVIEGLDNFSTVQEAWQKTPGADILYVRPNTTVTGEQAARVIMALGKHASAAPLNNDGMYPVFAKFVQTPPSKAQTIDTAAQIANNEPIPCPFPAGPCVLLAGDALARYGLPDVERFGSIEYAMAEWGARCLEHGKSHVTVANTYVATESPLVQPKEIAQRTLEHIHMWSPGFTTLLQEFQNGAPLIRAREDLDLAFQAIDFKAPPAEGYQDWFDLFEQPNERDRVMMDEQIEKWENPPKISIIFPTYNTPIDWLREAIESVFDQEYHNWELVIVDDGSTEPEVVNTLFEYAEHESRIRLCVRTENGHIVKASNDALEVATGDLVVFLDHDDTLAPHALFLIAKEFVEHPEAAFVYSDSDKILTDGTLNFPYFTPDFSYELLLAQNYVTHLCAYKLPIVKEIGGLTEGMEGSQDWDLVLRYLERTCGTPIDHKLIRHIPHVLYHWRQSEGSAAGNAMAKPYAIENGRKAVMAHLGRTNQTAFVGAHPVLPLFNLVRFLVTSPAPKVAILIPTKDNAQQLERCIDSVKSQTLYDNYEILILDNGSTDKRARALLHQYESKGLRVLRMPGQFNYAAMNNKAAEATDAEFLCLLNDDVEVIERTWLNDMVGLACRPKVGAVGAKLLYPDNTVQQCGIIFSGEQPPGQSALHAWQRLPMHDIGSVGRSVITAPYLAVTGACMVVRRSLWQEMNGMDSIRFPVDWNDVDFCIRLHKAGYRNIVSAMSYMLHHEGQTKKRVNTWRREQMLADERKLLELHGDVRDPYINPRLSFHPHMNMVRQEPYSKPWGDAPGKRCLLVNGNQRLARQVFTWGDLPFMATIEGHYLVFSQPEMPNVQPIDLRQTTHHIQMALAKLGIGEVWFCGIGDGTLGAVGYFAALAETGWHVTPYILKDANTGNELEYYDPTGWRATWQRLLDATRRPEVDAA